MSNIRGNNLSNLAGTKPPAVTLGEFVQARAKFNPLTGNVINDSFNVSSLTDNGARDHSVNFSSAFGNAHYAASANCNALASANIGGVIWFNGAGYQATTVRLIAGDNVGSTTEPGIVTVQCTGEYA